MDALGDCAQTARAVINRVHRRDDSEKNLRGANITGRFVAANVLLAGLQCESITRPAFSVVRNADEPAGHVAFVLIARCKVSRVWATQTEWNTKSLRVTDRDIRAEFARWF